MMKEGLRLSTHPCSAHTGIQKILDDHIDCNEPVTQHTRGYNVLFTIFLFARYSVDRLGFSVGDVQSFFMEIAASSTRSRGLSSFFLVFILNEYAHKSKIEFENYHRIHLGTVGSP